MPFVAGEYRLGTTNPVMLFEFSVTSWCNYRCTYCVTTVHTHRPESKHAFDHHDVASWAKAFERIPYDFALLCRGGEPFLDHENFARFVGAIGQQSRLQYMRVDTNGSWDPKHYDSVPIEVRGKVQLNVSFHPTQVTFDRFKTRLARIVDAGWHVGMINYVMEAGQAGDYGGVRDYFHAHHGIYVNPNPDVYDEALASRVPKVRREARRKLDAMLPPADVLRKVGEPTHGKSCFFPSIAYFISPAGEAQRACGVRESDEPRTLNFIRDSSRVVPLASLVSCPLASCVCLDRYAFLDELKDRGQSLNLLEEYVRDCKSHQERTPSESGPKGVWEVFSSLFRGREKDDRARRRLPIVERDVEASATRSSDES